MIRKVIIKNFQRHEKIILNLDEHVTTIVGPSDTGKSSILRAIRWTCLNRPRGESFVRDGSEEASVVIRTDDHRIGRIRGKDNSYKLDDRPFEAFGNDVPEEISAVLNVDEINFQCQHDGPFLLGESAPEVSRRLNEIVDLGLIDKTLSNLASATRKAKTELGVVSDRLDDARKDRETLKPAMDAHNDLELVERLQQGYILLMRMIRELDDLIHQAEEAERKARINVPNVDHLIIYAKAISDVRVDINHLAGMIASADDSAKQIRILKGELKVSKEEFDQEIGDTCPLCGSSVEAPLSH